MTDRKKTEASTFDKQRIVNIGQSIFIRGELTGSEDMVIEGKVDGEIDLTDHNLTIGPKGRIRAKISARTAVTKLTGGR